MTAPRHVPVLDGVRGVAVLSVLAFHLSWALPTGAIVGRLAHSVLFKGWVGVDLFFVLSGYLITRGLVAPHAASPGRQLRDFYARRALRIFPVYYATIVAGGLFFGPVGASYWVYLQNFAQARDLQTEVWTGHLWSLAIEEQFYLVWPALMLALPRRRIAVTLSLLALGVAARVWVAFASGMDAVPAEHFVYRATYTHADGLLVGALLALAPEAGRWLDARMPLVVAAIASYLIPQALARDPSDALARAALCAEPLMLAVVFAAIVSFVVEGIKAPNLARALSSRWLREVGRVSYGMYVLHWPLYLVALPWLRRVNDSLSAPTAALFELVVVVVGTGLVYGLARLSYRYFESPILALKARFSS